jgi:hypothetical protein
VKTLPQLQESPVNDIEANGNRLPKPSIDNIHPDISQKYSENLYKFMRKNAWLYRGVFRHNDGSLWIGMKDGWFNGCRLNSVLAKGAKTETSCWACEPQSNWTLVSDFWERYLEIGKCAIDTDHAHYGHEKDGRWQYHVGKVRVCAWCGYQEALMAETIVQYHWRPLESLETPRI